MIGVIANSSEHAVVREFFELFKTPWEFYQLDRHYDVLVCAGELELAPGTADLVVVYAGQRLASDDQAGWQIASEDSSARVLRYKGAQFPVYGASVAFHPAGTDLLSDEKSREPLMCVGGSGATKLVRIGYDLFHEIRSLLTSGQPAAFAGMPTLELHIAVLRDAIVASGQPLVEIPPVPKGYSCIACLTHDVDHPGMRFHKFDHTAFGFLYRAVFGTLMDAIRGRVPFTNLMTNWVAALKLPLIYLGLAKDPWYAFDRYAELEAGVPSSFFVIPFKGRPGRKGQGSAPRKRASGYGARDIAAPIKKLAAAGCEIGTHGIDAWTDTASARKEMDEVRSITGQREIGIRMHWLYFDERSPLTLERAGASYDSTVGYNETIGYRAGTTQAYMPLGAAHLLELPLHVMDTALFYPGYLELSQAAAGEHIGRMIDAAVAYGGVLTANWHDRSIAPERLWGQSYLAMIAELKARGAWFATASQTVAWFRKRRAVRFENVRCDDGEMRLNIVSDGDVLPGLEVRVHNGAQTTAGQIEKHPLQHIAETAASLS